MRIFLLVIIAIVDLLANYPYLRDVIKGKTKPNIASWSTWTLINIIIVVAAIAAGGAINTVVLGATYLVGSLSILLVGIFKGTRKYTLFDGICQTVAILGVVLWQLTNNPNIALLFVLIVDISAVTPTVRHAYKYPHEETWATFAIASVGALGLVALATSFSFASLAIPIEATIVNALLAGIIISRQGKTKALTK